MRSPHLNHAASPVSFARSGRSTQLPVPGGAGVPSFDPTKRAGLDQRAPLTPEYQKIFEAILPRGAKQAKLSPAAARSARYFLV
jgi:hypothetical protein